MTLRSILCFSFRLSEEEIAPKTLRNYGLKSVEPVPAQDTEHLYGARAIDDAFIQNCKQRGGG